MRRGTKRIEESKSCHSKATVSAIDLFCGVGGLTKGLEKAGIVSLQQLRGARRYAIVGSFAVAAVLTPPDVVSQLLLAIPLCILYEAALIGIWFTERKRAKTKALEVVE